MAKQSNALMMFLALVVVAVLGFAGAKYMGAGAVTSNEKVIETITSSDFCSNNPVLDLKVRLLDNLASSVGYLNGTIYLKNLDTGSITEHSVTGGGTTSFTTLSDVLQCTSKLGYEVYVKGTQDTLNSDGKVLVTPAMLKQDPVEIEVKTNYHSLIKVKAYDNDLKSSLYVDLVDSDNTTSFLTMNGTTMVVSTTANVVAKTVATDGFIDYTFTLGVGSSNQANGKGGYIAVNLADDSNTDDWDFDTLELVYDGQVLNEAKLNSNDMIALSAYEKVFILPYPIGTSANGGIKTQHSLDFRVTASSGVNPDFDPVLRFVALNDYIDDKDNSKIMENVGFRTDTSRTEIGSASTQLLSIDIS